MLPKKRKSSEIDTLQNIAWKKLKMTSVDMVRDIDTSFHNSIKDIKARELNELHESEEYFAYLQKKQELREKYKLEEEKLREKKTNETKEIIEQTRNATSKFAPQNVDGEYISCSRCNFIELLEKNVPEKLCIIENCPHKRDLKLCHDCDHSVVECEICKKYVCTAPDPFDDQNLFPRSITHRRTSYKP